MINRSLDQIKDMADSFRRGIEKSLGELRAVDLKFYKFPIGCCGDASELLANYFLINGIQSTYCFGTKYGEDDYDKQSHAWLELENGLIVDITTDQFKGKIDYPQEYAIPCYVGIMTPLHNLFEVRNSDCKPFYGFEDYYDTETERLNCLYEIISKKI